MFSSKQFITFCRNFISCANILIPGNSRDYKLLCYCTSLFLSVQKAGLDHKDMLKELPVTIRNSRLMNALLCELDTRDTQPKKMDFLGLSSRYRATYEF